LVRRLGAEYPQRRAGDEMALEVEGVVDGGVHAEKTLGGASRLEPLHFALYDQFKALMAGLVKNRLLRCEGNVYYPADAEAVK